MIINFDKIDRKLNKVKWVLLNPKTEYNNFLKIFSKNLNWANIQSEHEQAYKNTAIKFFYTFYHN